MHNGLRILVSAYACEPGEGSEQGVGWNWVRQIARTHEVWVITRTSNRSRVERELARSPMPNAHFAYVDLPRWARFWKKGSRGLHLYYRLWQFGAYLCARRLQQKIGFDIVHHVTFVNYWMPSVLPLLPVPFIWGPIGGGESAPPAFWQTFGVRGKAYELARHVARRLGELDPLTRLSARRAAVVMATTAQSYDRLRPLGPRNMMIVSEAGLTQEELARLAGVPLRHAEPFRLLSVGRLIHWKGFGLSLRAFARFVKAHPTAEYWVIGDGAERKTLERFARRHGLQRNVVFWGQLPRQAVLDRLAECDVLVHPSLHDSGGWVCLEAMAAGRPVVCLDLGGPGVQVTPETGIKVAATSPEQAIHDLAAAYARLASSPALRAGMGRAGRARVAEHFCWEKKAERLFEIYRRAAPVPVPELS
jgi:glycosyltransferase involved in cell wall biosynthesis